MVTKYGSEDISKATISRMATYLRCLTYLEQQGTATVSSRETGLVSFWSIW